MKRTNIYTLAPLALLLGLVACTQKESGMLPDGTQPLTLTASIEGSTTMRSTVNNTWDGGETIALQVDGEDWYEYTVDASGNMTGDYYWQNANDITVQGLFPATVVENLTWSVEANQSGDASYQSGDLLASDLQTVSYGSTASLAFYHQTAKVVVNVKDTGLPAFIEATAEDISLTLGGDLVLNGTFTLPTTADDNGHWFGAWELGDTKSSITPHSGTAATGCIATYEALVIPQTIASGTQLLTITLSKDGTDYGTFLYTLKSATEWSAGYVYTYNVQITSTLELELSISTGIDWNTGSGGTGSVTIPDYEIEDENTYIVYTAKGLQYVAELVNGGQTSINITLARDINLTNVEWTPIGNSSYRYTGTFDGGDHTITGLTINEEETDYVGLIGYLGEDGKVQNLTLENLTIYGGNYVGSVAGYNSGGTLTACTVSGTVTGSGNYVGGVVGYNNGIVTNCNVSGRVTGNDESVGGVVGENYGTVTACYSSGSVTGSVTVGSGYYIGGVVGLNYGTVTACYSLSSVSGYSLVGGVVGKNYYSTVTACYHASGSVSCSTSYVGGVAGWNDSGTVTACYWSSDIDNGIYYGTTSGATKVEDNNWSTAVDTMNKAISDRDSTLEWQYEITGDNTLPTLTKKSEE